MKVVFFGTPQFSATILSFLIKNGIHVVAAVSKPDKPKGRSGQLVPTPVKIICLEQNPPIPVFQPEKVSAPEFAFVLPPFQADLFVVVAYGEIIKQHILDIPKMGCINLHPSLLPKYRGAAPIQRAIMAGETETGVSIMHMVRKMDAGDVIRVVKVPIGPDETYGTLADKLFEIGASEMVKAIHDFANGQVKEFPQDETLVTFAHKIELQDCRIDWNLPAQAIHNLVRGVNPHPGAWCYVLAKGERKLLKVWTTRVLNQQQGVRGQIQSCNDQGMQVCCGEGSLLIKELQLEGKRIMTPSELLRGVSIQFL